MTTTTAPETGQDPDSPDGAAAPEPTLIGRFSRALRNPRKRHLLSVLRNPYPGGHNGPADIARLAELAQGTPLDHVLAVGAPWMRWHSGQDVPHYGRTGTSIGRAMRQIGSAGIGYGPSNPRAQNELSALLAADDIEALTAALVSVIDSMGSAEWPPHWETLDADVRQWSDPEQRARVRVRWAQDFHTVTRRPEAGEPAPDAN